MPALRGRERPDEVKEDDRREPGGEEEGTAGEVDRGEDERCVNMAERGWAGGCSTRIGADTERDGRRGEEKTVGASGGGEEDSGGAFEKKKEDKDEAGREEAEEREIVAARVGLAASLRVDDRPRAEAEVERRAVGV